MDSNLRLVLIVFLALVQTSLGESNPLAHAEETEERPNIMFIVTDDQAPFSIGAYGNQVCSTPNLDQLAADGLKLLDCYAASPNCSPARTGIMTGRSPYRVGMYDFARFRPMLSRNAPFRFPIPLTNRLRSSGEVSGL